MFLEKWGCPIDDSVPVMVFWIHATKILSRPCNSSCSALFFLTDFLKTGHKVVHSMHFSDQVIVPTKGTVLHAYEY